MAGLSITIGLGCQRGVARASLEHAVAAALHGLGEVRVAAIASVAGHGDEPTLRALAEAHGWPLRLYTAAALATVPVPSPSPRVAALAGTPSVAEAAALLAADGGRLLRRKLTHRDGDGHAVTIAVAEMAGPDHGASTAQGTT